MRASISAKRHERESGCTMAQTDAVKTEKERRILPVVGTDMFLPITVVHGQHPGKCVVLSAGVHSREYIGIEALLRFADRIRSEDVCGTIVLLHCCNYSGFIRRSGDVVPADGKNLNRAFPGSADGTATQKLAAFLQEKIIPGADYMIDLHSGGFCEALIPHCYYHGAAEAPVCARSYRLAQLTSPRYLVRSCVTNGFYSYAGQCGVPAILLERGGCGLLQEAEVEADVADVMNILRGTGVLCDAPAIEYTHTDIRLGHYENAPCSGCWYPRKQPGDRIQKNEILGEIRTIYGDTRCIVHARADGVILYQTVSLGIEENTPMVAYGAVEREQHL